ncbi:hypothetical protein M8K93_004081 [Escherichia coli]|nr:hypothetical protein [Escherichia coli]
MFKTSVAIIMLGLSCSVSAVGIPVIDPGKPIKISESAFYSCDQAGNALDTGRPMRYQNKAVVCRNDNLWVDGKALSFIDVTSDFLKKSEAAAQSVRVYGLVCNKQGVLWERRREKIDVTEAVWIDGELVHCIPEKSDILIDGGSYLMGDEGSFIIDNVKYPRSEIVNKWYKSQMKSK